MISGFGFRVSGFGVRSHGKTQQGVHDMNGGGVQPALLGTVLRARSRAQFGCKVNG